MRVCFIDDEPEIFPMQYGGKARTIVNLAKNLLEFSEIDTVRVMSRSIDDLRNKFDVDGVQYEKLDYDNTFSSIIEEASEADILSVHTCSFTFPRLPNRKAALVYNLHDVMLATADKGSHLDKAFGGEWDVVVSPSEFATRTLGNFATSIGAYYDVRTIPRGIDLNVFSPIPKQEALAQLQEWGVDLSNTTDHLLFMPNRPGAGKGDDQLEEVCNLLAEREQNHLVISPTDQILPNRPHTKNVGWIPSDRLKYFYSAADATLCLSQLPESFSQVSIESIACGTPVVSTAFGNLSEHGKNIPGVITCQPETQLIAEQIQRIFDNPRQISLDIEKSRSIISERFGNTAITKSYVDLYKSLIEGRLTTPLARNDKKFFASPFIAQHNEIVYRGNDKFEPIERFDISPEQALVLGACTIASSLSEMKLTTNLESGIIIESIRALREKRLIIGDIHDT